MNSVVVLISGSTGIAAPTIRLARESGARVFVASLEDDVDGPHYAGDLSRAGCADEAVDRCIEEFGQIDALFNVAGASGRRYGDAPVHECTDEGWRRTLDQNLSTTFALSRAVLRHMLARGRGGAILNMASVVADSPEPRHFATHAYAASKGAIIALTKSMAAYYAPHKIRVNAIAPGLVRTPMSRRAQENPELLEFMKTKQPITGGIMEPDEIARAAWFLLTSEAITGEVLHVDGGWHIA